MSQQTPPTFEPEIPPAKRGLGAGWIVAIVLGAGIVLMGVPCLGLLAGIMLPALGKARQAARETIALTNVRAIGQSLVVRVQNSGTVPMAALTEDNWADVLVAEGFVTPEMLVSPTSDGIGPDYFYVPFGSNTFDDPRRVWVYEDPAHHRDGVAVAFIDGHAELVPHEEFPALLEASEAASEAERAQP